METITVVTPAPTYDDYSYSLDRAFQESKPGASIAQISDLAHTILSWQFAPDRIDNYKLKQLQFYKTVERGLKT